MKVIIISIIVVAVSCAVIFFWKNRLSENKAENPEFTEEECVRYSEAKEAALERVLGKMHDKVFHAMIPFNVGGALDMYLFPNGIPGTGFASMELIQPDGSGPMPNRIGTYELVAFTKLKMPPADAKSDENHPFNAILHRMWGIMTQVAHYSHEAVLNPGETCEVPGKDGEPGRCLIFNEYSKDGVDFVIDGRKHCLLLCIEVFRSEMEYAMNHGSAPVLKKLKEKGHYPYSDLDREPVF